MVVRPADMRLVILGAGSFIGRALSRRAASLGLSALSLTSRDLDLTEADAGDRLASLLEPTDVLLFLAALTPDRGRGLEAFDKNMQMGSAVTDALSRRPVEHVVYVSSDAVYPFDRGLVDEETPTRADTLYAAAHLARETMIRTAAEDRVTVLRSTLVFGPGDTHRSYGPTTFCRNAVLNGDIPLFGFGEEFRDHVFIDDVVAAIVAAAQTRQPGLFNVASGRSIRYADLAKLVADMVGGSIAISHKERRQPITHRHFCIDRLRVGLTGRSSTRLTAGIARTLAEDPELTRSGALHQRRK